MHIQVLDDEEEELDDSSSGSESGGNTYTIGLGGGGFNFEVPPESFIAEEDIVPDAEETECEPMIVSVELSNKDNLEVCPRASATTKMDVGVEDRSMGDRSLSPMVAPMIVEIDMATHRQRRSLTTNKKSSYLCVPSQGSGEGTILRSSSQAHTRRSAKSVLSSSSAEANKSKPLKDARKNLATGLLYNDEVGGADVLLVAQDELASQMEVVVANSTLEKEMEEPSKKKGVDMIGGGKQLGELGRKEETKIELQTCSVAVPVVRKKGKVVRKKKANLQLEQARRREEKMVGTNDVREENKGTDKIEDGQDKVGQKREMSALEADSERDHAGEEKRVSLHNRSEVEVIQGGSEEVLGMGVESGEVMGREERGSEEKVVQFVAECDESKLKGHEVEEEKIDQRTQPSLFETVEENLKGHEEEMKIDLLTKPSLFESDEHMMEVAEEEKGKIDQRTKQSLFESDEEDLKGWEGTKIDLRTKQSPSLFETDEDDLKGCEEEVKIDQKPSLFESDENMMGLEEEKEEKIVQKAKQSLLENEEDLMECEEEEKIDQRTVPSLFVTAEEENLKGRDEEMNIDQGTKPSLFETDGDMKGCEDERIDQRTKPAPFETDEENLKGHNEEGNIDQGTKPSLYVTDEEDMKGCEEDKMIKEPNRLSL